MASSIRLTGMDNLRSDLRRLATEFPLQYAKALTFSAEVAREAIKTEMQQVFDRPTPYALNSLYIKSATSNKPEASVFLKNEWSVGTFGVPATRYLAPEIIGGTRRRKGAEAALTRRGILGPEDWLVPAQGAPLDQYGNIPGSTVVQMLSSLGALRDPAQNAKLGKPGKTEWFVMHTKDGKNTGIARMSGGRFRMVFAIVREPKYKARLKFWEIGRAAAETRFEYVFGKQVDAALDAARR